MIGLLSARTRTRSISCSACPAATSTFLGIQTRFRARATEISRFDYRDPKSRAARIGAHISARIDISVGPRAR